MTADRKKEAREKLLLGGIVVRAGLSKADRAFLLGGLLELARTHAHLPGAEFVDALISEAAQRARAHGGLTDDIAVVRVERTTR